MSDMTKATVVGKFRDFTGAARDWPLFSRKFRGFFLGDETLATLLTARCKISEAKVVKLAHLLCLIERDVT